MTEMLELIKTRRNVKHFLPKYVSWENVTKVLDAARHAPSSGNIQNWKFIIFFEPELKQKLASMTSGQDEISAASVLIIVCSEPEKVERYYGEKGEKLYHIQNCAAAIQNMLLTAHSLGLGTRWVGAFDEEEVKSLASIPDEIQPQAIIALGYPREVPPKPPKYPLETLVYFHNWRSKMRDPAKYMHDIATIISRKMGAAKQALTGKAKFIVDKTKKTLPK